MRAGRLLLARRKTILNYYLLQNPKSKKTTIPILRLIRQNVFYLFGVLKQLVVKLRGLEVRVWEVAHDAFTPDKR